MTFRIARHTLAAFVCLAVPMLGQSYKPSDVVPLNPKVKTGVLANGTRYYIMNNAEPKKRLELMLVVDAGAVLEDKDQDGLAHFCEHMAFNGTKSFPKQQLVNFLESTGIRFGADLNAYTNQDETVYTLTVPLDDTKSIVKGIQVLRDWAGFVTYDDADIEAERGVVTEEWRLRTGADARVNEVHTKVLMAGSKYADRDIIGDTAVLRTAPPDNLRRFYKTWYTPDHMAVILVGDASVSDLQAMLEKHFVVPAASSGGANAPRPTFPVTPRTETAISIASDKELSNAMVNIVYVKPPSRLTTYDAYRKSLVMRTASTMMNTRLYELTQKSAIGGGGIGAGALTRSNDAVFARAIPSDKNVMKALDVLVTEIERVKKHGFVASELDRTKESTISSLEAAAAEANSTPSQSHTAELARNFLVQEASPGVVREFELTKEMYATVTLDEVNAAFREAFSNPHRVVSISVPEGNGYTKPTEGEVRNALTQIAQKSLDGYTDQVPTKPLLATKPTPGSIVKTETNNEVGTTVWTLSNGARVIIKPTDFKSDEIQFSAWAPGGQSLADPKDQVSVENALELIGATGTGDFSPVELQKMLAGKNFNISASSSMEWFELQGGSTPKDLPTFFEALYLGFTAPRKDAAMFESIRGRIKSQLENKDENPESVFSDSVSVILADHHPRVIPTTVKTIESINFEKAYEFTKKASANAGAYTFLFVGNVTPAMLEDYVKTYIASLPATKEKATWKDAGIHPVKGSVKHVVKKGVEPKGAVSITYSGPMTFGNRYDVYALSEVMTIKLREKLREELGGVYFVSVQPQTEKIPDESYAITVYFTCKPERVEELIGAVNAELAKLQNDLVEKSYVDKVREIQTKERETAVKTNGFWRNSIKFVETHNMDYKVIRERNEQIKSLSAEQIRKAAKTYLGTKNIATVVLVPEK